MHITFLVILNTNIRVVQNHLSMMPSSHIFTLPCSLYILYKENFNAQNCNSEVQHIHCCRVNLNQTIFKKVCSLPQIYHIAVTEVNSLVLMKVILIYCEDQTKPTHILDTKQLLNIVICVVSSTHYRPKWKPHIFCAVFQCLE